MTEDNIRKEAVSAMKKHRSGWIGLGRALFHINLSDDWKDWGYDKFQDYCKEELGITIMTAKNMMAAFEYIKSNEPGTLNTLESNPDAYIPDYNTLASLSKAVKGDRISGEKEDSIRDTLFNANEETSASANRQAKDMLSESSKKDGEEIMEDIRKKTASIKKRMKKLNSDIHNTSSFNNEILEMVEKLSGLVSVVEV